MRRVLLAAVALLSLFGGRESSAAGTATIELFYDTLSPYGAWVELGDYGYCWQPSVAVSNTHWRPYSDGYWAYTDLGWTWVSYEDFGWATYHYGRWVRLRDRGWFWRPGYEWGPAWVSWRTGGDYVGWAPLPPRAGAEIVYEGRPLYGDVDIALDIGPLYYNFIDVRYIGEPLLRERIFDPAQNVTYVQRTVNVTNITYNNSQVYNYGPDYTTLSAYSTRPIQRLSLQREANADIATSARQPTSLMQVQGDKLLVAAPLKIEKPPQPVAPKTVKEKLARPTVERGWSGITDQRVVSQLKEKMKAEDPKRVPPPDITPKPGATVAAASAQPPPPAGSATPALPSGGSPPNGGAPSASSVGAQPPVSPPELGKGKNRRGEGTSTSVAPARTAAPGEPAAAGQPVAVPSPDRGKGKTHRTEQGTTTSAGAPAAPPDGRAKSKNDRHSKPPPAQNGGERAPGGPPHGLPMPRRSEVTQKHERAHIQRPSGGPAVAPQPPRQQRLALPPPPARAQPGNARGVESQGKGQKPKKAGKGGEAAPRG